MFSRTNTNTAAGVSPFGSDHCSTRCCAPTQLEAVAAHALRARLSCHCSTSGAGPRTTPLWLQTRARKRLFARQRGNSERLCCLALQQIDYSFYQQMDAGDVDAGYLWSRLEPLLGYLSDEDRRQVRRALDLAFLCHDGQRRKSGEPFVTHPVEVTRILAELRLDRDSLVAGLLHDTVEDTDAITFDDIERAFGQAARRIVEGETKFSKIGRLADGGSPADLKAIDLQQLFLSMTEEVRIILVKLADRLHNLRTLASMPPHKQKRIADETLQVFAPLARLLGLHAVQEELEETSFRYSDPEAYGELRRRMEAARAEQGPAVEEARRALQQTLEADLYLKMRVGRIEVIPSFKSLYELHRKLSSLENAGAGAGGNGDTTPSLGNVAQLVVVVHEADKEYDKLIYGAPNQLCYHLLGLVHSMWAPIPGKVKDYIATPKSNGYQSLHTTVLPLGSTDLFPLELHIRTDKMHEIAEFGIAAEGWASPLVRVDDSMEDESSPSSMRMPLPGKVNGVSEEEACNGHSIPGTGLEELEQSSKWGKVRMNTEVMNRKINWLTSIREWQEEFIDMLSAREFVDTVTGDLLGQRVFVFTPTGEVMHLPKGSTVVDFAYHVHTGVGNTMVAAKVNCNLVHPSYELKNAEVVEILTYSAPPNSAVVSRHKEWYQYAKTRSARHKLTKFLRDNGISVNGVASSLVSESDEWTAASYTADGKGNETWLIVECYDKSGLLAEVTSIISSSGHNITEYSGSGDGVIFTMKFRLQGDKDTVADMCQAIDNRNAVLRWSVGCNIPYDGSTRRAR
uniref:Putative GTP diphosphokinase RSH1, chloroplastic n=1 Tax=Tetraselmis sp. GSL018 TaxID=582737 RepID=A0A061QR48_9CHLO|eukprot:CAMPEP_0177616442 /NCGR_PEP_ID=MMETSP0419_2-20121207/24158_1 /TAXON_ID=582737 /ORGANISM="Tetraselmis sp., Strain GSL018" /LENGTH=795 /DNA_ID=CAMNT_0019114501 /DNA_START=373 /DNA_END=2760 /DNA_ORIENTATION=+